MKYSEGFGINSSKILLGTAYFGDTISEAESFAIMDTYVEHGGNHIDTARLYADGEAERVIGRWFRSRNPKGIHLSTKGGFPNAATPHISRLSEQDIRFDLEASLTALERDCIDFYWLHRDDETLDSGEIIEYLNQFVKEGKIKKFGASNWRMHRVNEANQYAASRGLQGFEAVQVRFSPAIIAPNGNADRTLVDMDKPSFDYYAEHNMPVAAYASQAKGFFSKMVLTGEEGLSPKSKERYLCEENLKRLESIKALSEKYACSIAAAVCGALCSISAPSVFPIIGGSRVEQIKDSMSGADIVMDKAEVDALFAAF